jgi:hypothetical protein
MRVDDLECLIYWSTCCFKLAPAEVLLRLLGKPSDL